MSVLKVIPFVMVDPERGMFLTTRRWKPEPYWCGHGRRTWIVPLRDDPTLGHRFHGEPQSFGAILEMAGCDSPIRIRRGATMRAPARAPRGERGSIFSSSRGDRG